MMVISNMLAGYNVLYNLKTSHYERAFMNNCMIRQVVPRSFLRILSQDEKFKWE